MTAIEAEDAIDEQTTSSLSRAASTGSTATGARTTNTRQQKSSNWKRLPALWTARQDAASTTFVVAPKESGNSSSAVIVVGGRNNQASAVADVELLEWNLQRRWWPLPSLSTPRCGCAVVSLPTLVQTEGEENSNSPSVAKKRSQLYVIGGVNEKSQPLATMETYIHRGGASLGWNEMPTSMGKSRMYPSAVSFVDPESSGENEGGRILVVGGRDERWQELDSCEMFSTRTGEWKDVPPMRKPRFGSAAVYLQKSHSILVFGGYTGPDEEWTTSCEEYKISENRWESIPPFKKVVQFCQATVMAQDNEDYIVLRGHTVRNRAVLQCLHVPSGEWIILPANSKTIGANIASLDRSRIVVMGGAKEDRRKSSSGNEGEREDAVQEEDTGEDHELQTTRECWSWMAELQTLFGVLAAAMALAATAKSGLASPKPRKPKTASTGSNSMESEHTMDDETTVHPFLYPPPMIAAQMSSNASVYSTKSTKSAKSTKSSQTKSSRARSSGRRKVKNHRTLDNFGEHVSFTGYVISETERPQGKGRMTWILTGDNYEGSFEQGARQGRGKMIYSNGDAFAGIFQDDQREGKGVYRYKDGRVYEGNYVNDMPDDKNGKMEWRDGTTYQGHFSKGKRSGKGKIQFPGSNAEYQGDFVNGKYHGTGQCHFGDGSVYRGQWKHGKAHGLGMLLDAGSNVIHDGKWVNDAPVYPES